MEHENEQITAIYFEDVFSGYEIYELNEDYAIIAHFDRWGKDKARKHKIYWTRNYVPYMVYNGIRVKLDNFRTCY